MKMERKYVRRRRVIAVIVFLAFIWVGSELTTPKTCKVDVSHMSPFCKELLFP